MQPILSSHFAHLCDLFIPFRTEQSINKVRFLAVSGGADSVALLRVVVALCERDAWNAINRQTSENKRDKKNAKKRQNIHRMSEGFSDCVDRFDCADNTETNDTELNGMPEENARLVGRCADVEGDWRQRWVVVHFDHAVRSDSAEDAEFVRKLAETHQLRYLIGRRDPTIPEGYRIVAADPTSVLPKENVPKDVPSSAVLSSQTILPRRFTLCETSEPLEDTTENTSQPRCESIEQKLSKSSERAKPAEMPPHSEERLRAARYHFLRCEAERLGATSVLLAHTFDDQIETVLYRILRGTGIRGLGGIPYTRALGPMVRLVRPMLHIRRVEIEAALREIGQNWREDSSNRDLKYTRNRIRHELLPLLETQYASGVRNSLSRLSRLATEVQQDIDTQLDTIYHAAVDISADQNDKYVLKNNGTELNMMNKLPSSLPIIRVFRKPLESVSDYMVREIFQRLWREQRWSLAAMSFEHWNLLLHMVRSKTPRKNVFPGRIIATVKRNTLWFDISERVDTHE